MSFKEVAGSISEVGSPYSGSYAYPLSDDTQGQRSYQRIDQLNWSQEELENGKLIKIRGFPKDKKVKLFESLSLFQPTGRTTLQQMMWLTIRRMQHNRCGMSVGVLRNFTER